MSARPPRRAAAKPRLTLLQRQQQLLDDQGFSAPPRTGASGAGLERTRTQQNKHNQQHQRGARQATRTTKGHYGGRTTSVLGVGFDARQEAHLAKQGRTNATSSSRQRAEMPDGLEGNDGLNDAASVTTSASRTPSLHPSLAGTTLSQACSDVTIGAGDDTEYWDFQHRAVTAKDLGHTCRECRLPFTTVGEPLTERRGARISSRYHAECFSGYADPRSQAGSSHHTGHLAGKQMDAAPARKATSKMRTGSHFEHGGAVRGGTTSMGGKHGAMMSMGSLGFGATSSKGAVVVVAQPGPGGFTAAELEQHTTAMQAQEGEGLSATGNAIHREGAAKMAREERISRFLAEQRPASPSDANLVRFESEPEPAD